MNHPLGRWRVPAVLGLAALAACGGEAEPETKDPDDTANERAAKPTPADALPADETGTEPRVPVPAGEPGRPPAYDPDATPKPALQFFQEPDPGLRRSTFVLEEGATAPPDGLEPIDTAVVASVAPPDDGVAPGRALRFEGFVRVRETGPWRFGLSASGTAELHVADERITGPLAGAAASRADGVLVLAEGWHALRIDWTPGTAVPQLSLALGPPDAAATPAPEDALAH